MSESPMRGHTFVAIFRVIVQLEGSPRAFAVLASSENTEGFQAFLSESIF
jgi:hypothetical protein